MTHQFGLSRRVAPSGARATQPGSHTAQNATHAANSSSYPDLPRDLISACFAAVFFSSVGVFLGTLVYVLFFWRP